MSDDQNNNQTDQVVADSTPAEPVVEEAPVEETLQSEPETTPAAEVANLETNTTVDNGNLKLDEEAGSSKLEDNQNLESEDLQISNVQPQEPASSIQPPTPNSDNPNAKWYVVHTYSGHENKVAVTLKQRVESEHLEKKILDVLVPTQDKIEIKGGKKATIKEKIFPGYILVKMVLEDDSWLAVRTTQGVTSFVGMGNKPTPISDAEVATIVKFTKEEAPVYKQVFSADDTVKIVDGPFADFIGKVDHVDEERGKVKVLVSIFGRETPVELDFLQIQKI